MMEQIEEIRKQGIKNVLVTLAVVCALVLVIVCFVNAESKMAVLMVAGLVGLCVCILAHERAKQKFLDAYKNQFLKGVLEKEFEDLRVDFERGFSEREIEEGHLLNLYERFDSDDYIAGKYCGIPFECSDVKIEDVVRSGKTTTVVTRFQGMYLKVKLKKQFSGWMVVREREFLDNGNPRGLFSDMPSLEKIQVEDEKFNQTFSIYASDGQEAFYLLTPSFMERMLEMERKYEGRCLFGFWNKELHIAVDSREDHFDASLFEAVDKRKVQTHLNDIEMIKGWIELVKKECEVE